MSFRHLHLAAWIGQVTALYRHAWRSASRRAALEGEKGQRDQNGQRQGNFQTRSRSQVEGLRINGRIWNIPCDFGHFSVILQNMLIPVSYILEITIKKVKFSLFS